MVSWDMQTARRSVSDNYIIHDMSQTIFSRIQESNEDEYLPAKSYHIFNEDDSECYGVDLNQHHVVTRESIENYIWLIYKTTKMELECLIPAIIYLQNLLAVQPQSYLTKIRMYSKNWKTLVGMSMLLASKVWDDFHMDNASFLTVMYCMDLQRCNKLEILYLRMINFNVSIKHFEYTEYEERIMYNRKLHSSSTKKKTLHGQSPTSVDNNNTTPTASISTGASTSTLLTIFTEHDDDPAADEENLCCHDKVHEVSPHKPVQMMATNQRKKEAGVNWYSIRMQTNRINGLLSSSKKINSYQLNCDSYSSFLEQSSSSPKGVLARIKCVIKGFMPYMRTNSAKISLCTL
jgi:hypothetical protein